MYDSVIKLCRQQAEVIQNHENENFLNIDQSESRQKMARCLNLVAVTSMTIQVSKLAVVA
jgi:hypothetical protein